MNVVVSPAMTTESLLFLMVDVGRLFVFWVVVVVVVVDVVVVVVVVVLVLVLVVVVVVVVAVAVAAGGVAGGGGAAGGGCDVDVGVLLGLPVLERCQVKGVPPLLTRLNWIMIVRK